MKSRARPQSLSAQDIEEIKMTNKQIKILNAWNEHVTDNMSTPHAIQYVADITGSTYAQVVSALSADAKAKDKHDG